VIASVPISVYEVAMHTEYYTQPRLQRHVIRILWMVPIYGVDAWFALRFRDAREYLDPVRECYEAFVIYNFYAYLMQYLEGTLGNVEEHLQKKPPMQHIPVVRWLVRPWQMGAPFLFECKKGVLNYVIIRPVCTTIGFITDIFGKYGQGQIDFYKSYIYLATATNFSQMWALYCLAMMYTQMHEELAPIRPLSKFLTVKAVVFVTFWQGVLIAILVYTGVISKESWTTYDQLDVATGIQDFLICIEMFIAALAHAYAFPPRDYMDPTHPHVGFFQNVKHMFDLTDVVGDVQEVVGDHVETVVDTAQQTTTTVLKLPKRAVRKVGAGLVAAAHAPESLYNLLTGKPVAKKATRVARQVDSDDEEASRCALLSTEDRQLAAAADTTGAGAGLQHGARAEGRSHRTSGSGGPGDGLGARAGYGSTAGSSRPASVRELADLMSLDPPEVATIDDERAPLTALPSLPSPPAASKYE